MHTHTHSLVPQMNLEATSSKVLRKTYEKATTVVWAGGYGSNMVPIHRPDGGTYNFALRGSKVKVDGCSQLLRMVKPKGDKSVEKPIERLFGMGVGFGHLDDVIDGVGTFVSYRAPSILGHITKGCFDTMVSRVGRGGMPSCRHCRRTPWRRCVSHARRWPTS